MFLWYPHTHPKSNTNKYQRQVYSLPPILSLSHPCKASVDISSINLISRKRTPVSKWTLQGIWVHVQIYAIFFVGQFESVGQKAILSPIPSQIREIKKAGTLDITGFLPQPMAGLEPATYALRMRCSTNWATSACSKMKTALWLLYTKYEKKQREIQKISSAASVASGNSQRLTSPSSI